MRSHPGRGDAAFVLSDFSMFDYFTAVNAILRNGPVPIPASASVSLHWNGTGNRLKVRNVAADFAGQYEDASADVNWSVANADGYAFSTANSSDITVSHAFTAHVHTGSFHRG